MIRLRFLVINFFLFWGCAIKAHKIVGLVPVRNEAALIGQCLKCLSCFTDAIVVLDDASTDETVEIVKSLARECNIKRIIEKKKWYRDEPGDKNKLLNAGRKIGGTHFIVIDADEIFTSNCLDNNFLRNRILQLKPGDKLCLTWIQLWRSVDKYRYDGSVWSGQWGDFIFCDDKIASYRSDFIHTSRSPSNLKGKSYNLWTPKSHKNWELLYGDPYKELKGIYETIGLSDYCSILDESITQYRKLKGRLNCYKGDYNVGLMHFQFVNWDKLLIKQAWYRCLERIRWPNKAPEQINKRYRPSKDERDIHLKKSPAKWFSGYSFFDKSIYKNDMGWQKQQVLKWFKQYGKAKFAALDIWDVDWRKI